MTETKDTHLKKLEESSELWQSTGLKIKIKSANTKNYFAVAIKTRVDGALLDIITYNTNNKPNLNGFDEIWNSKNRDVTTKKAKVEIIKAIRTIRKEKRGD